MPISNKQRQILAFPYTHYDALIADGAIRSGKTVFMTIAFVDDAMRRYNNQRFAICGKTVDSTIKNIIVPYLGLKYVKTKYKIRWSKADHILAVRYGNRENIFEVFGGKDESSFALIQGRTLAGVLLDEVALQPRSFVEQALARCSVDGSRYWFNCNPGHPMHWFKTEWIDDAKNKNVYHLHFKLEDNPSLSDEVKERYHKLYTGVFYRRYILGEWCAAEGVCYPEFADNPQKYKNDNPQYDFVQIGVDFGGNKSAHAFVATGIKRGQGICYLMSRRIEAQGVTPEKLYQHFDNFLRECKAKYPGQYGYTFADCAEQTLIAGMASRFPGIKNSLKNPIVDRIRATNALISLGKLSYTSDCKSLVDAMLTAVWDDTKLDDVRLDNGTSDIDTLDAAEYSWESYLYQLAQIKKG